MRILFSEKSIIEKILGRREKYIRMSKDVSFKNRDRFIQLGIAISTLRKMRGLSQEKLAEQAGISRSLLSAIEAPSIAKASITHLIS